MRALIFATILSVLPPVVMAQETMHETATNIAGETTMRLLSRLGMKEGDAIEHPWLSKNVERAQKKVEERNFQIRKNILEYDEVMEHQRQRFYGLRQRVLEGRDVKGLIFEDMTVTEVVQGEAVVRTDDIFAMKGQNVAPIAERLAEVRESIIGLRTEVVAESQEVTVLADRSVPFRVVKKVMSTCTSRGYGRISLAVLQKASQAAHRTGTQAPSAS